MSCPVINSTRVYATEKLWYSLYEMLLGSSEKMLSYCRKWYLPEQRALCSRLATGKGGGGEPHCSHRHSCIDISKRFSKSILEWVPVLFLQRIARDSIYHFISFSSQIHELVQWSHLCNKLLYIGLSVALYYLTCLFDFIVQKVLQTLPTNCKQ